jgi:hypothetical protein
VGLVTGVGDAVRLSVYHPHVPLKYILAALNTLDLVERALYPLELVIGKFFNLEDLIVRLGIGPGDGFIGNIGRNLGWLYSLLTISEEFHLAKFIQEISR